MGNEPSSLEQFGECWIAAGIWLGPCGCEIVGGEGTGMDSFNFGFRIGMSRNKNV